MSIDRLDFDNLSEGDLTELVAGQVPEGIHVDYKRDMYGGADSDKRELLKDVSAFANAHGGHLVIGIQEENGLPTHILGVTNVSADEVTLRLDQIIRTGLEPRIQGLRIRAVPLATGAHCFVLRIPRSWHPPHRVSATNSNRFFIRNSGGAHEASVDELRTLFTIGADALNRVHAFRDQRMEAIVRGQSGRPLVGDGRLILHIVPLAAVTSSFQVDLAKVSSLSQSFTPIGATGFSERFNFEGFVMERGGDENHGYTQIFRSGIVEATKAPVVRARQEGRLIPSGDFERQIFRRLPAYIDGMRDLGVPPPLVVLLSLEGVKDAMYFVRGGLFDEPNERIEHATLYLPEALINDYGNKADYHLAVKPAFDALWNTAGDSSAKSFSATGEWVGFSPAM